MTRINEGTLQDGLDGGSKAQPAALGPLTETGELDSDNSIGAVTAEVRPVEANAKLDAKNNDEISTNEARSGESAHDIVSARPNDVAEINYSSRKNYSYRPLNILPSIANGEANSGIPENAIRSGTSSTPIGTMPSGNPPPAARVNEGVVGNKGAYVVWVADASGTLIRPPKDWAVPEIDPNPSDPRAVMLAFFLLDSPHIPPEDQVELQLEIAKVEKAIRWLFKGHHVREKQFQIYFVRLFHAAQLGLTGQNAVPGVARRALGAIIDELIDEEGGRIKNGYLAELGRWAAWFSVAAFFLFFIIKMISARWFLDSLAKLNVDSFLLSSFAVLWIGCFVGVWLSYGIRKPIVSLADLTRSEDDRVAPPFRLAFAGLLTTIIGLLFSLDIIAVTIGGLTTSNMKSDFMVALLVGMFCGISELALPTSISTRAGAFVTKLQ